MPNKYVRRADGTTSTIPQDMVITFNYGVNAEAVDTWIYVAKVPCEVVGVEVIPTVAGTDGGAVTAAVKKASGTTAVASGTAVHSSTADLKGTANTLQDLTLSTTRSERLLAANDRLGVDFTGTLTSAVGLIQVRLKQLQATSDYK